MPYTGKITTTESGVDLVVEWKIDNCFNLPETVGAYYGSTSFSFGGERWWLRIYPNGFSESDSSGHVSLELWKYVSWHWRSTKQSFSLFLKTAKGEKYNEQHLSKDFDDDNCSHTFNRFITRSELTRRRSDLAPDDTLTVICTMKSSTSAETDSNTASSCCHCKITFNAQNLSSHQRKCMHRPIKCPDCLDVVVLQKWLDEHKCQKERTEESKVSFHWHLDEERKMISDFLHSASLLNAMMKQESLEENSKNNCVEAMY